MFFRICIVPVAERFWRVWKINLPVRFYMLIVAFGFSLFLSPWWE
jgi:hypothetical protein